MKRCARILVVGALLACAAPAQQAAPVAALPQAATADADPRLAAALRRDPSRLPRAPEGRWAGFDPKALRPEELSPRYYAALAALERAEPVAALAELYSLLDEQPGWPPALHQCAVIHFRLQRYGDSAACARRFLEECPSRVGETRVLGHALYSLGLHAEARAHYERVLAAAPRDTEARRGLALCHARLGEGERALALLDEVVREKPGHVEAWTWIARLAFDAEDLPRARSAAERAAALDPFDPAPRYVLAQVLAEAGEEARARAERERFETLSRAAARLRQLESEEEYAPREARLPLERAQLCSALGDARRTGAAVRRWLQVEGGSLAAHLQALDLLGPVDARELERSVALRSEELAGDSVPAWKRLEAYWLARGDQAKSLAAGERWRRLERGG